MNFRTESIIPEIVIDDVDEVMRQSAMTESGGDKAERDETDFEFVAATELGEVSSHPGCANFIRSFFLQLFFLFLDFSDLRESIAK